jgi:ATP-binding cassette subfamily C (CFTR/MRP) protein 10
MQLVSSVNDAFHTVVLRNINLAVKQGQLVGICGAVGSGKSSLLAAGMHSRWCKDGQASV